MRRRGTGREGDGRPSRRFTSAERALVRRLDTPEGAHAWLRAMPYNRELRGETLRTFRSVARTGTAHCLEAALSAATVMEAHGLPPLLLDLESVDDLDHVVFLFRRRGRWGTVAKSRDPGLHGRRPVFRSIRDLVWSYFDPYIDATGRINGYGVLDLRHLRGAVDWRLGEGDVWEVQDALIGMPHRRLRSSDARYRRWHARYLDFLRLHPGEKPVFYPRRERWM